jgi:hypothetical protein
MTHLGELGNRLLPLVVNEAILVPIPSERSLLALHRVVDKVGNPLDELLFRLVRLVLKLSEQLLGLGLNRGFTLLVLSLWVDVRMKTVEFEGGGKKTVVEESEASDEFGDLWRARGGWVSSDSSYEEEKVRRWYVRKLLSYGSDGRTCSTGGEGRSIGWKRGAGRRAREGWCGQSDRGR